MIQSFYGVNKSVAKVQKKWDGLGDNWGTIFRKNAKNAINPSKKHFFYPKYQRYLCISEKMSTFVANWRRTEPIGN